MTETTMPSPVHPVTVGVDLGDRKSKYCVLTSAGEVARRRYGDRTDSTALAPQRLLFAEPVAARERWNLFGLRIAAVCHDWQTTRLPSDEAAPAQRAPAEANRSRPDTPRRAGAESR